MQDQKEGVFLSREMLQSLNWHALTYQSRGVVLAAASLFLSNASRITTVEELSKESGLSIIDVVKSISEIIQKGFAKINATENGKIFFKEDIFGLFSVSKSKPAENETAATILGSALRKTIPIRRTHA